MNEQPRMNETQRSIRLNLGCGHVQPNGWINVDGSNRAWLSSKLPWVDSLLVRFGVLRPTEFSTATRYANLLKPLAWKTASVDAIYLGEVLEHFTFVDGQRLVRECRRILRPGGAIRIRVPDHARFWSRYLSEFTEMMMKPQREWTLHHTRWTEMYFRDICVRRPPLFASVGHFHKWMYDEVSLIKLLEAEGFESVTRMEFRRSAIRDIDDVEVREDLIVEGYAPNTSNVNGKW